MEKMEKQMQAKADKPAEVGSKKKPYETPRLTKLGSVEQLTQGLPPIPSPDVNGLSA